jgi:lambda family phage portal protein
MGKPLPIWKVLDASGNVVRAGRKQERFGYYRGADTGRIMDWPSSRYSADRTLLQDRATLIYRTRERMMNDPILRGAQRKLAENIVGRGIRVESALDYERLGISEQQAQDIEAEIEFEWAIFREEADYSGNQARRASFEEIQTLQETHGTETGEAITIPRYVRRPGYRYSFCLQVLESDRIGNPSQGVGRQMFGSNSPNAIQLANGNQIRDGVEVMPSNQVAAIWVANQHPEGISGGYGQVKYERIPAVNYLAEANFWMDFAWYRPDATRGEPGFACVLSGARQLGDYVNSELTRAEMAALFGVMLERGFGIDDEDPDLLEDDYKKGDSAEKALPQIELYPGAVRYLGVGDKPHVINPNLPGAAFESFTDRLATFMGSPIGLTRELILNTFQGNNFSNTRTSLEACRRGFRIKQAYNFERRIWPVWQRFMDEAVRLGRLALPGYNDPERRMLWQSCEYYPEGWPYLEPEKDAKAAEKRMAIGVSTLKEECGARGVNWRDNIKQRAKERRAFESEGLDMPEWMTGGAKQEVDAPEMAATGTDNE